MDEAVSLCQAVSSGNPNTLAFFLLPQWHSSTSKTTVLKNRRLLEDKVVGCPGSMSPLHFEAAFLAPTMPASRPRCLDVFEVAMNFAESSHAGDRRKKSQQCSWPAVTLTQEVTFCLLLSSAKAWLQCVDLTRHPRLGRARCSWGL